MRIEGSDGNTELKVDRREPHGRPKLGACVVRFSQRACRRSTFFSISVRPLKLSLPLSHECSSQSCTTSGTCLVTEQYAEPGCRPCSRQKSSLNRFILALFERLSVA